MRKMQALVVMHVLALSICGLGQNSPRTTAQSIRGHFASTNQRLLTMAKDFPEEKYDFKLTPEMRTFGAVLVHVVSGNIYAAKTGRGQSVNWDELDPKDYKGKDKVVQLVEKSIGDSEAALKNISDEALTKNIEPWVSVIEHSAEHYGLLVAYYRANGLVPPESRPK